MGSFEGFVSGTRDHLSITTSAVSVGLTIGISVAIEGRTTTAIAVGIAP